MPEYSSEALAAAKELRSFGDYILTVDWGGRGSGKSAQAIASAAKSRASQVEAESAAESAEIEADPVKRGESFESELTALLNRYSQENASGTPDFILADFLLNSLYHFQDCVVKRASWRGESVELPALQKLREEVSSASQVANASTHIQNAAADEPSTIKRGIFGGTRKL